MDERRLRKFFHFTETDLLANRRGGFSAAQKQRLEQAARTEQTSARSSTTILFVIAAAGLAIGLTIGSIAPTLTGRILILLLMALLWPAAWVGKGTSILRSAYALQEPRLLEISGRVHIVHHGEGEYGLQVGGLEFDVEGNPSGVVLEGDAIRIYYLQSNAEILAVDYVRDEKD